MNDEVSRFVHQVRDEIVRARAASKRGDVSRCFEAYEDAIVASQLLAGLTTRGLFRASEVEPAILRVLSDRFPGVFVGADAADSLTLALAHEAVDALHESEPGRGLQVAELARSLRVLEEWGAAHVDEPLAWTPRSDFGEAGLAALHEELDDLSVLFFHFAVGGDLIAFTVTYESGEPSCVSRVCVAATDRRVIEESISRYLDALSDPARRDEASRRLDRILDLVAAALSEEFLRLSAGKSRNLLIVPYGLLHVVPFHALRVATGEMVADRFDGVVYAPSLTLFTLLAQNRSADFTNGIVGYFDVVSLKHALSGLFAFAMCYGQLSPRLVVPPTAVTASDILEKSFAYVDCHGSALSGSLMASRLQLPTGNITFRDVLKCPGRSLLSLCFLNACETGIKDSPSTLADEYYPLDGAFLAKGSSCVISTLGPVSDLAGFLVALRFFDELSVKGRSPARALSEAQAWLRRGAWQETGELEVCIERLPEWVEQAAPGYESVARECVEQFRSILDGPADVFADPLHWAMWRCSGPGVW